MDLLKSHRRRSKLSEIMYVVLNIGFAAAIFAIVVLSQTMWLAIVAVLLGKWRALAVRPRFWFANLVANMVDMIVGISFVILLFGATGVIWVQLVLTLLYIGWLLFIKPRSSRHFVAIQAGVAVFLGVTALSMMSYAWDTFFFVAAMWLIGYAAARHIIGSYEEQHTVLYSLVSGVAFAELGWIGFHWLMAYPLYGFGSIQISQLALFMTLFGLIMERAYVSYHRHGVVKRADIMPPIVLTIAVLVTLFIFSLLFGSDAL